MNASTMSIQQRRQHWMSVLARADLAALEDYYNRLATKPEYRFLRQPEIGLTLMRGRMGGTGSAFNFGEMTMARCVVETARGTKGFGYVKGRSRRHAELAALFDALLQEQVGMQEQVEMQEQAGSLQAELIEPLHRAWQARRDETSRKAAATKVNFMTMVRGD